LLLCICLSSLYLVQDSTLRISTAIGERRIVDLEDGSRLTIDANSAVEVHMSPAKREFALLRGRASFDVAPDKQRPFTVAACEQLVVATGTAFMVELFPERLEVALYEGHVRVMDRRNPEAGSSSRLEPGTMLTIPNGAKGSSLVTPIPSDSLRTWESGQIEFEDELLPDALARVNRYATKPILAQGQATARVTGVFNTRDTEGFLEGVAAVNGLRIERLPRQIVLSADPHRSTGR
jgi:transmembrane sensor